MFVLSDGDLEKQNILKCPNFVPVLNFDPPYPSEELMTDIKN